jgi:uncharacterized protein (DUF2141 family)
MYKITAVLGLILLFVSSLNAQNIQLKVVVKNLNVKAGGRLFVALYDLATFPIDGKQLKGVITPVNKDNISTLFTTITSGKYAVAIYQDINGNSKLDKNFVGYPTEPFAFSRNYKVKFSAPKFKDVCFDVKEDLVVEIKMP